MKPRPNDHDQGRLWQKRLSYLLDPKNSLYRLADQINWKKLEQELNPLFCGSHGAPAKHSRLIIGLMMLQHMFDFSDEAAVYHWIENPYWQFFCGYDFLQWDLPCHASSLSHWRKRLGEKHLLKVLALTIEVALDSKTIKKQDLKRVIADTTVMPKNITYPTDAKLYVRGMSLLTRVAKRHKISLRQTYSRGAKAALWNANRYAHARQMNRARKHIKWLRVRLGRIIRDIERKTEGNERLAEKLQRPLDLCKRLYDQRRQDKNKIYSLHEPEVDCISKGKAGKKYEFGCKVSLVVTHKQGLVLSSQALSGNPFDGHTLEAALSDASDLSGVSIREAYVDRGYRGHGIKQASVYLSGTRKASRCLRKKIHRRQAIEPHIGHMKSDGRLNRNYLRGTLGDKLQAILVAIGHNLRLIQRNLATIPT